MINEYLEIQRCKNDLLYFATKYVKFPNEIIRQSTLQKLKQLKQCQKKLQSASFRH